MQHTTNTAINNFSDLQNEEMDDFDAFLSANNTKVGNEFDELERYLADLLFPRSRLELFDVLAWWKINAPRYPTILSMARDILVIPITSVPSKAVSKLQSSTYFLLF